MTLDELNTAVATSTAKPKSEQEKAVSSRAAVHPGCPEQGRQGINRRFRRVRGGIARPEREGRNPQTGKAIKIAASKNVKFKPGKGMQNSVNT